MPSAITPERSGEYTGPRWMAVPRGKYHLILGEGPDTACGGHLYRETREALYPHSMCLHCKKAAEAADLAAAEERRQQCWTAYEAKRRADLERNRSGRFTVVRCTRCGAQRGTHGGYWCEVTHDLCVLEAVEAVGPAWERPEAAR